MDIPFVLLISLSVMFIYNIIVCIISIYDIIFCVEFPDCLFVTIPLVAMFIIFRLTMSICNRILSVYKDIFLSVNS